MVWARGLTAPASGPRTCLTKTAAGLTERVGQAIIFAPLTRR
jgi:hypothetical protein